MQIKHQTYLLNVKNDMVCSDQQQTEEYVRDLKRKNRVKIIFESLKYISYIHSNGTSGGTRTPDTRITIPLLCNNGSRDHLTLVSIRQTLPHSSDWQMATPLITVVDSDHLTAVIFSTRIWFPDSILRDNAGHQSARCYIEGWV